MQVRLAVPALCRKVKEQQDVIRAFYDLRVLLVQAAMTFNLPKLSRGVESVLVAARAALGEEE